MGDGALDGRQRYRRAGRRALGAGQQISKDMDQATAIANKSVKQIEDRFAQAGKVIGDRFGAFSGHAAAQLGVVGAVLEKLGPIGITVAVAVGALALAFAFLEGKVAGFVEKAKALRELSELTGVTTANLQAVGQAAKTVGVDSERMAAFITRLAVAWEALRTKGTGDFGDQLLRIGGDQD